MNTVLNRFNKLRTIYNIIGKDLNNHYSIMIYEKPYTDETANEMNEHTLTALMLAKEKIIELEKEINATSQTTDA